eukprot:9357202-Pyramimonas_sp.AAC.1
MMRQQKFDPAEPPRTRAELNNDVCMNGCQCQLFYDSEPIGYSIFSMLGDPDLMSAVGSDTQYSVTHIFGLLPRESPATCSLKAAQCALRVCMHTRIQRNALSEGQRNALSLQPFRPLRPLLAASG